MSDLKHAALHYANYGWPVVPLHFMKDGRCSCGKADCRSPGKHPRTPHGGKDSTTDGPQIESWWSRHPCANIGVATGCKAGIVVLDVDPRHGGDDSLAELEREHGELPPTVEALTGGGGRHLVFRHPGGAVRNRSNMRPGIDVRGDGGFVVAPPSTHASGASYRWREGHSPEQMRPAQMPDWLVDVVLGHVHAHGNGFAKRNRADFEVPDRLAANSRAARALKGMQQLRVEDQNDGSKRLFTAACVAVRHDLSDADALATIRSYLRGVPTPRSYSDAEILQRVHDAERNGDRGSALGRKAAVPTRSGSMAGSNGAPDRFKPFPVDTLPEPLLSIVQNFSAAIGCDPTYVVLPLLAALASAIGRTRRIELKPGWSEPAIVWAAIVGESGTLKTPAFRAVMKPLLASEFRAVERHQNEMRRYEASKARHDKEMAAWKKSKNNDDPPEKPQEPSLQRSVVADTTVEALAPILLQNPRGVLLARDELASWLGSFDRYSSRQGGDAAHWLSMHSGEALVVDRKTATPRTIFVPAACVSIAGSIQPGVLTRMIGREHREAGLLARLLLVMPPRKAKRWSETEISSQVELTLQSAYERLMDLDFELDADGKPQPVILKLTPEAKRVWAEFFDSHAEEQLQLHGDLSAAWSKLEGYAARFALIFHCVRSAFQDPGLASPNVVDARSVAAGVALSRWCGEEARRIYGVLEEDDAAREDRLFEEWVAQRGGTATVHDVTHGLRSFRSRPDLAEAALQRLVDAGRGDWAYPPQGSKGGRPSRQFALKPAAPVTETSAGDSANGGFGYGDSIGMPVATLEATDGQAAFDHDGCPGPSHVDERGAT